MRQGVRTGLVRKRGARLTSAELLEFHKQVNCKFSNLDR